MKTYITLLFVLLVSVVTFAQGLGMNYKAVIKDENNNLVANNPNVTIQFEILKGISLTSVYNELHTTSTDANGIVNVTIGKGALLNDSPAFNTINWGSDEHFLNVKINTGLGLIDMGTTEFMTVPYALSSKDNQWLLNGSNISNKNSGNIGIGSNFPNAKLDVNGDIRLQYGTDVNEFSLDGNLSGNSTNAVPTEAAVKTYVDNNTTFKTTSNVTSNSEGTIATDDFVFGDTQLNYNGGQTRKFFFDKSKGAIRAGFVNADQWNTQNIGDFSTAFGFITLASGDRSTALGSGTIASRFASTAIGNYNMDDSNAMFMIGNGTSNGNRNNAFVVKDDGDIILDGELNTTSTGTVNMVPVAVGRVSYPGSAVGGTGNFTVSRAFVNNEYVYTISVNGRTLSENNSLFFSTISSYVVDYVNGNIEVYFGSTSTPYAPNFGFIIYQF